MIKFLQTEVVFQEIPDEVTLAVNITNCQHNCPGCHSSYLRQDIGNVLTEEVIDMLILENEGVTCFCFMGEGNDKECLKEILLYLMRKHPKIRRALYSGSNEIDDNYLPLLNYYKIGSYDERFGPLNKETTNQRLYEIVLTRNNDENCNPIYGLEDITYKFWKKNL